MDGHTEYIEHGITEYSKFTLEDFLNTTANMWKDFVKEAGTEHIYNDKGQLTEFGAILLSFYVICILKGIKII